MMMSRLFQPARMATARLAARPAAATATTTVRRTKATMPPAGQHYGNVHDGFKKHWLTDAGAYPIMVILSFAVTMCGSFTAYKAITSPDARMAPSKRTALLRFWQ